MKAPDFGWCLIVPVVEDQRIPTVILLWAMRVMIDFGFGVEDIGP